MGNRIKKHLTITLSAGAFTKLEKLAASNGLDRSNTVELLINGTKKGSPKPRKVPEDLSEKLDRVLAETDDVIKKYVRK